jgi:hypothetical protein
MSTTYTLQRFRFHFSSEQDYKVRLNYFRFNKIEYYTYQAAANKAHKFLLRGLPPEVTAEMVLGKLKHLDIL